MVRTPVGNKPQPDTQAALFAYLAARLADVPVARFNDFFGRLGIKVRRDGAMRAMKARRFNPPTKSIAGRKPSTPSAPTSPALRDWLLVDEAALEVETALLRFPGSGRRQSALIDGLTCLPGVRQVIETAHLRDVFAVVIFLGPTHRRDLRAQVEELAPEVVWDDVLFETHEPTVRSWQELARRTAAREGLA